MIVTIHQEQNYLESIAMIVSKINQGDLKIILPTTSSCSKLQQLIVKHSPKQARILPNIVPIINIDIKSENIYNIPYNLLTPMSRVHQRTLLTNIIRKEDKNITISAALDLSFYIMRLFDELGDFSINVNDLEDKTILRSNSEIFYDVAEHWKHRAEFLKRIYQEWQKTLSHYSKIDLSQYRKNILRAEIDAAQNNLYPQIIAGIFPSSPLIKELASIISLSNSSYFIPPAMDISKLEDYNNTSSKTHYYYQLGKISDVISISDQYANTDSQDSNYTCNDTLLEFSTAPNLRIESELIVDKISSWLNENKKASIAMICQNNELINMCSNLLSYRMISNIQLNGYSLVKTKPYEFLILLIEAHDKFNMVDLEKLMTLLKTHYLFSKEIRDFELSFRKNNLEPNIYVKDEIKQLSPSLKSYISLAEKLAPNLWYSTEGKALSDFLYEVLQIENIEELTEGHYVEFLNAIAQQARYHKNIGTEQVIFMSLEDASVCGYDYIIISDMNEGSIPNKTSSDPWMNPKMRENIGLIDMSDKIGIEWYYFKNLLHRKRIYMTRAEKKNGVPTQTSRFLQELISSGIINAT